MKTIYPAYLFSSSLVFAAILSQTNSAVAQDSNIVPDDTLGAESSVVNTRDETSDRIDGGAVRGSNLFHSFEEFNIGEGRGAYFANPDAVNNIFSRVTGSNPSNILGTLGVDGAADLYLINPNGIVFGENSSLDVQGSFTATTAEAIEFGEGGLFSAVTPGESLLTISVPLGLQFGSTPGSIVNRSFVQDEAGEFVGLQVPTGENLTLVGGEVRFEAGEATARGGNISIGGLSELGTVGLSNDGSLNFPNDIEKADLSFTNAADVDVKGTGGGNINLNARNLNIESGESGSSQIRAGITANSTSTETQTGDITLDATDEIKINDSLISNQVDLEAVGNAGNIFINTGSLSLNGDEGLVDTRTYGQGNGGNININVLENIEILDGNILSEVGVANPQAKGNAGDVTIKAQNLILQDGGKISSSTFGRGNPGDINIDVSEALTLSNNGYISSQIRFNSAVSESFTRSSIDINAGSLSIIADPFSIVTPSGINTATFGQGNAGNINIDVLEDIRIVGGNVSSEIGSPGVGNAGNINIQANSLSLENRASLDSRTAGIGNPGNINIDVTEAVTLFNDSDIFSMVYNDAKVSEDFTRNSVNINANSLSIIDDDNVITPSVINTSTFATGNAGNINLNIEENIEIVGGEIFSNVESGAVGNGGNITLLAQGDISFLNGARINADLEGEGIGGNISIETPRALSFDSITPNNPINFISTNVITGGVGQGGNISIKADSLFANNTFIDATTFGQGSAGEINIVVDNTLALQNSTIFNNSEQEGVGNNEGITIEAKSLFLENNSKILNQIRSPIFVEAGGIKIDASFLSLDNESSIDNSVFGKGQARDISINVDSLSLSGASQISGGVFGKGQAGNIVINANDFVSLVGNAKLLQPSFNTGILTRIQPNGEGSAGDITIKADSLSISGAQLSATVQGEGSAGDIVIQADDSVNIINESVVSSSVDSGAEGFGGEININSKSLSIEDGSQILSIVRGPSQLNSLPGKGEAGDINIDVSNTLTISGLRLENGTIAGFIASAIAPGAEGIGGDIEIKAGDVILNNFASLTSSLDPNAIGNAGNINIEANSLSLNNGEIKAITQGQGNAGNIQIDTKEFISLADFGILSSALGIAKGSGGNIQIDTSSLLLKDGSFIDAVSASVDSKAGNINVNAFDITLRNDSDISTFTFQQLGEGGNIILSADSIVAFDDSDIFASAPEGKGGNITLDTPAFFAENFTLDSLEATNLNFLENNDRADLNATGAVSSGAVDIPDVSFIQNSLTELPNNSINTDELVANSCVVPAGERSQGKFVITGGESLPVRPGDDARSMYPTGEVRGVSEDDTSSWQPGDPIAEPQGAYRLANGKMVLSRECL